MEVEIKGEKLSFSPGRGGVTKKQLQEELTRRGLTYKTSLRKEELYEALRQTSKQSPKRTSSPSRAVHQESELSIRGIKGAPIKLKKASPSRFVVQRRILTLSPLGDKEKVSYGAVTSDLFAALPGKSPRRKATPVPPSLRGEVKVSKLLAPRVKGYKVGRVEIKEPFSYFQNSLESLFRYRGYWQTEVSFASPLGINLTSDGGFVDSREATRALRSRGKKTTRKSFVEVLTESKGIRFLFFLYFNTTTSHFSLVCFDRDENLVIQVDPNSVEGNQEGVIKAISFLKANYQYFGFLRTLEGKRVDLGPSLLWSIYFADLISMNPNQDFDDLLSYTYRKTNSQLQTRISKYASFLSSLRNKA